MTIRRRRGTSRSVSTTTGFIAPELEAVFLGAVATNGDDGEASLTAIAGLIGTREGGGGNTMQMRGEHERGAITDARGEGECRPRGAER